MQLFVVRHGETEWNKEEVFRGRRDVPLNERGIQQAQRAGAYFSGVPVKRIVSSPLQRAFHTAGAISRETGVPVETMEEFVDMALGIWEGVPLREIEKQYPDDVVIWSQAPDRLSLKGGETLVAVRERISRGIRAVTSGPDETVVLVTHTAIVKNIVLYCLNIDEGHFWDMKFDPGSITLLERLNNRFSLAFSNDTCHEREALPPAGYRDF